MENSNEGSRELNSHDTQNAEEFISSNPNENPAEEPAISVENSELMHRNADTDPNRYSIFTRDDIASDGSDNFETPLNDKNASDLEHYSIEDDRHLDTISKSIQDDKIPLTDDDKDGFFEGL